MLYGVQQFPRFLLGKLKMLYVVQQFSLFMGSRATFSCNCCIFCNIRVENAD